MTDSLERIAGEVRGCTRCRLAGSRTHAVPGQGAGDSRLVLVGEAPGATEDRVGEPFQGPSGRFLDACLAELGVDRGQLYLTSVNKCRPPGNRAPRSDEITACAPYLDRQLTLLRPKVVLAMGATAAARLHPEPGRPVKVEPLRGLPVPLGPERVLLVTFHPAAAMRFPQRREPFREDLARAVELAGTGGGAGSAAPPAQVEPRAGERGHEHGEHDQAW